jgi:hypothetical protein
MVIFVDVIIENTPKMAFTFTVNRN